MKSEALHFVQGDTLSGIFTSPSKNKVFWTKKYYNYLIPESAEVKLPYND